ncbi:MAG: hypothetical protein IKV36_03065 [Clostridia bacterium]|nr:hypothetical protein [Clostridia bacterium]
MRKTTKFLACLMVVCMLVACLPLGTLLASAETMTAEPSKNSTPGAIAVPMNENIAIAGPAAVSKVFTSTANGYTLDLTDSGYTTAGVAANGEYGVEVLKNTFAANDTWTLEFDETPGNAFTGKSDYRTVLNLGDITTADGVKHANGFRVMLQGNTLHVTKPSGNSYGWETAGNIGMTIPNGGTIHFSFTVREYKVIDIVISNGTKTFTYSWNIANQWGDGFTPNLLSTFTLSHKNIYMVVNNITVSGNKPGVTPPTAENNLVLTDGKWVSNYNGKVYPFTADKDSFYINTSVAGQVASGTTAFTTSFDICPFNTNNAGYTFDATKSYVISANVARANSTGGTNPNDGKSVVARLFYYFGTYNNKDLMIYFDKNGYHWCKEGYKTYTQSNLLKNVDLLEYARITAYVSPFEIEIYVNGEFLTSMPIEDPSLLKYDFKFRSAGTEAWFKDVAIWENTANGDEYYDVLSEQYNQFTAPGVRTDLDLTSLKATLDAYTAGSANTTLTPFVKTFVGATKTVVNNLVLDGTTLVGTSASKYFDHDASNDKDWKYGNINLFNGTSPFTPNDDFIVEADYVFGDVWYNTRIGFALNSVSSGDIFIQGKDVYVSGAKFTGTINGSKPTVKNSANRWHVKFIVKGGEGIQTVITDSNTGALYYDFTAPWSSLKAESVNKENYNPVLYFTCGNFDIKNIYVGFDVTDAKNALNATVTEYAAKDTNGFTAETVKNFTDALAAANTVLASYTKYSNAEINAAAVAVVDAYGKLEKATVNVPVGDIEIEIAPDEDLPVNERVDTKYVLGWKNPDGSTYEGKTYIPGLVAEFVETKMMSVRYQLGKSGDAIRYIASVDETERYATVGWLFSIKNANPEKGGANVVEKSSTKVYSSLLANGVEKTTADIYGDVDYSKYLYVFEIRDIPEASADTTIYVRPYVEMNDGTIVYGDVSERTLNQLKAR